MCGIFKTLLIKLLFIMCKLAYSGALQMVQIVL